MATAGQSNFLKHKDTKTPLTSSILEDGILNTKCTQISQDPDKNTEEILIMSNYVKVNSLPLWHCLLRLWCPNSKDSTRQIELNKKCRSVPSSNLS
jgi:hypothetical protein